MGKHFFILSGRTWPGLSGEKGKKKKNSQQENDDMNTGYWTRHTFLYKTTGEGGSSEALVWKREIGKDQGRGGCEGEMFIQACFGMYKL